MKAPKTGTPIMVDLNHLVTEHHKTILADDWMYADFKNVLNESFMRYLADKSLASDEYYIIENFMFVNQLLDETRREILLSGNFQKGFD